MYKSQETTAVLQNNRSIKCGLSNIRSLSYAVTVQTLKLKEISQKVVMRDVVLWSGKDVSPLSLLKI